MMLKLGYLRVGLRVAAMLLIWWPVILFPIVLTGFGSGASYDPGMGDSPADDPAYLAAVQEPLYRGAGNRRSGAILWGVSAILPELPD